MTKNGTEPVRLSPDALNVLKFLAQADKDDPWKHLNNANKTMLNALAKKDLIFESAGDDGVRYKITGRGVEAIKTHTLDTSNKKYSSKRVSCEDCLHRYVLDQVQERLPLVVDLLACTELLSAIPIGNNVPERLAAINELSHLTAQIEQLLTKLQLMGEVVADETL